MLLFTEEHIKMNQEGTKTETRRLWKKQRAKVGSIHLMKKKMLSKKNYGKLFIKKVWQEHLLNITEAGAQAEGGYTREEYLRVWFEINPKSPPNPIVFVVRFQYIGEDGICIVCGHKLSSHIDEETGWRCHSLGEDAYQCECFLRKKEFNETIQTYSKTRRIQEQLAD